MPAIQEVVSAMVCGHEQAAATTNGAARAHESKHHRGQGPLLPQVAGISVGAGGDGATHGREQTENAGFFCRSGPRPRTCRKRRMFRWGRPCLRTDRKRLMGWFRGHGPLLPQVAGISVGTGGEGATHGPEYPEKTQFFCRSGPCPRTCRKRRMFRWKRPCLRTDRKRLMEWFRGHGPLLAAGGGHFGGNGG